jgi:hypothetical protein
VLAPLLCALALPCSIPRLDDGEREWPERLFGNPSHGGGNIRESAPARVCRANEPQCGDERENTENPVHDADRQEPDTRQAIEPFTVPDGLPDVVSVRVEARGWRHTIPPTVQVQPEVGWTCESDPPQIRKASAVTVMHYAD